MLSYRKKFELATKHHMETRLQMTKCCKTVNQNMYKYMQTANKLAKASVNWFNIWQNLLA